MPENTKPYWLAPDTMPPDPLGSGRSELRNRVLGPIFKDLELIEAWGTGLPKIRDALADYPEIEFILREEGHSFQVQFRLAEAARTPVPERVGAEPGAETGVTADQVTDQGADQVTDQVERLLRVLRGEICPSSRGRRSTPAYRTAGRQ